MTIQKLIEVALPLDRINAESSREKSIRHGHPSTMHLWWSRKPLATARAVIWSSLVDDPSSHPEQFPTEDEQNRERQRLFKILEDLIVWENSDNDRILSAAKAEILKSTGGNPPELLDPFAGGGSIPLEAQRLGLKAHAHDLNPVAVMINKAMIEIPPRFANRPPVNPESKKNNLIQTWIRAQGLAEDVRYYGEWMKQEAFKRIGHLYPKVKVPPEQGGGEAIVIAWIWARTVKCPNPACGCELPLVHSFELSKKKGSTTWIEPIYRNGVLSFNLHSGGQPKVDGTVNRKGAICICCGMPVDFPYIREEGKKCRLGEKLSAVVAEGKGGRLYILPDKEQIKASQVERPDNYPNAQLPNNPRDFKTPNYGISSFGDLFTNRQLTALTTFSDLVKEAQKKAEADAVAAGMLDDQIPLSENGKGARAYGEAVGVYLAFTVDKAANLWSSIVSWMNDRGALRETFARQAIPMVWGYAEANPFSTSGGNFSMFVERCVDTISYLPANEMSVVRQHDAQSDCLLRDIVVSTDPPYYDNIGYADLSDFFYVWMRQSLKDTYPELFGTLLVPKAEELVVTPYRCDGDTENAKRFFENGMLAACKQIYKYASQDIPISIYYAYKQSDSDEEGTASSGWETMLGAIVNAGFSITGTWPVRTESPGRSLAQGTNALASSIVLVCRKRPGNAPSITRRNLINILRSELRPALKKLQDSNIAPVDMAQSAIGPGMGVFSRYRQVLGADGQPMSVRDALKIINEEIDRYFNEQVGEMDSASRFCVDLYTQFAFNEVKYGVAEVLATAKSTSIPMMAERGVLYAKGGIVHLFDRSELSDKVNVNEECVWLLAQQFTKAMAKGGNEACATILKDIFGSNGERAKDLAYRLYTIAERKNWADEAYAYNSLVVAWPDIQKRAAELKETAPVQHDLFEG